MNNLTYTTKTGNERNISKTYKKYNTIFIISKIKYN